MHLQFGGVHRFREIDIDYDAYKSDAKANYAGSKELNLSHAVSDSRSTRLTIPISRT